MLSFPKGEMSKFTGCSPHIQQPAADNLHRKSFIWPLYAAAFWLQRVVIHFDVSCNDENIEFGSKGNFLQPYTLIRIWY